MNGALQAAGMPNDRRDEPTGRFAENFPDAAFIEAVGSLGPFAASGDIADVVGCTHATANMRLRDLADEGRVEKTERAGANLWSLSSELEP